MNNTAYTYLTQSAPLQELVNDYKQAKVLAVDIETMGIDPLNPRRGEIRLIQMTAPGLPVSIIDWWKMDASGKQLVKELLETPMPKIFHNGKFDMKFLSVAGINLRGSIFDTFLAEGVLVAGLEKQELKLQALAKKYLNMTLPKEEQQSDWSQSDLSDDQLAYAARDVLVLLLLRIKLINALKAENLINTAKLEFDSLPAMVEMELNGVKVEPTGLANLKNLLTVQSEEKRSALKQILGVDINPNSPKQITKAFDSLGIHVTSTKAEELSKIAPQYPAVQALLDYKNTSKQLQFAEKIPQNIDLATGRIYSQYFQLGTATGRLSCSNYNLQQVPHDKAFRECFIPEVGNVFVISDYSQMQIRIAAEISGDREMIEAYNRGDDLHSLTAALISGQTIESITKDQRSAAKALNFGMLFGMGPASLVTYAWGSYGVELTELEAKNFIEKFFRKYHGLKRWQTQEGRKNTQQSFTIGGRRRLFDDYATFTKLINTPIQGTEADILKKALGILPGVLKETSGKIIACVHDELLIECREKDAENISHLLQAVMEQVGRAYLRTVPVVAEATIAKNWAEK